MSITKAWKPKNGGKSPNIDISPAYRFVDIGYGSKHDRAKRCRKTILRYANAYHGASDIHKKLAATLRTKEPVFDAIITRMEKAKTYFAEDYRKKLIAGEIDEKLILSIRSEISDIFHKSCDDSYYIKDAVNAISSNKRPALCLDIKTEARDLNKHPFVERIFAHEGRRQLVIITKHVFIKQKAGRNSGGGVKYNSWPFGRFVIKLRYDQSPGSRWGSFKIRALSGNIQGAAVHPHVKIDKFCSGDAKHLIQDALAQYRFFDMVDLVQAWLTTYGHGPYRHLSDFPNLGSLQTVCCGHCVNRTIYETRRLAYCKQCKTAICNSCSKEAVYVDWQGVPDPPLNWAVCPNCGIFIDYGLLSDYKHELFKEPVQKGKKTETKKTTFGA